VGVNVPDFGQEAPHAKHDAVYYAVEFVANPVEEQSLDLDEYQLEINSQSRQQAKRGGQIIGCDHKFALFEMIANNHPYILFIPQMH